MGEKEARKEDGRKVNQDETCARTSNISNKGTT